MLDAGPQPLLLNSGEADATEDNKGMTGVKLLDEAEEEREKEEKLLDEMETEREKEEEKSLDEMETAQDIVEISKALFHNKLDNSSQPFFPNAAKDLFAAILNFGRSLGVKFMIGIQNVEQIFNNYGESRARSLLSGFLTSVIFRVNDPSSKQFVQELFGKNRKKEVYMASVQGRGIMEEVRDAFVVEDWDIANLKLGQAIIGFPGQAPFLFQFKKV